MHRAVTVLQTANIHSVSTQVSSSKILLLRTNEFAAVAMDGATWFLYELVLRKSGR